MTTEKLSRLALPALPLRRVTDRNDREEPDDLDPSAVNLVLDESLRFCIGESVFVEQTWGEAMYYSFVPRTVPAVLLPDHDVKRRRLALFEPIVEEFQVAVLDDHQIGFEGTATPVELSRAVLVLYACLYPLLLGVKNQSIVNFDVVAASESSEIVAAHAKGSETKKLAATVLRLLSSYRRGSLTGLVVSQPEEVGRPTAVRDALLSDEFRRLSTLVYQLGVPDVGEEILPKVASAAQRIAAQAENLEVVSSAILVSSFLDRIDRAILRETFGGEYVPPVVETATVGPQERKLAAIGAAYTPLPLYARRQIRSSVT